MSYVEQGERYVYFDKSEETLIENWLKENGYTWGHNTVCGSCCGMYADEYWINGVGGTIEPKDKERLETFLKNNNVSFSLEGYTLQAVEAE